MKVFIVLIPWFKAWHIHFACIISLNKLRNGKASQIDIFTNKLDNSGNNWIILTHCHSYFQCSGALSARVPKCLSAQEVPECLSALSVWMPKCFKCPCVWVPFECCPSAHVAKCPSECPNARVLSKCLNVQVPFECL